jgi:hypothetical protein
MLWDVPPQLDFGLELTAHGEELLIEPRQSAVLADESAQAAIKISYLCVPVARVFAAADDGGQLAGGTHS